MRRLVLGADGGGSKTAVRIAAVTADGALETLGDGYGGPSNVRAVGRAHAEINLNVAVDAALRDAQVGDEPIEYAVLGLAGSSLPDVQAFIRGWAERRSLARIVDIVHDADPVLAAGIPAGDGIALIVGTGSVAIGVDRGGQRTVTGGWGHLFGDTGSGYDLGRQALAAVADAVDGLGPETALVERILARLGTDKPREMLLRLDQAVDVRREIAALAPVLLHAAADGDDVALGIVDRAAASTAKLVQASAAKLGFPSDAPIAVAGGIVCRSELYRHALVDQLHALGLKPRAIAVVDEPVDGCLIMARDRLLAPAS
ncbi:MAG: BadF/BadG/BcrA/BcrD ATPase family protein [Woeseiaceae bacterium]